MPTPVGAVRTPQGVRSPEERKAVGEWSERGALTIDDALGLPNRPLT